MQKASWYLIPACLAAAADALSCVTTLAVRMRGSIPKWTQWIPDDDPVNTSAGRTDADAEGIRAEAGLINEEGRCIAAR